MDENRLKRSEEQLLLDLPRPSAAACDQCTNSLHIITKCTSMEQLKCDMQMWLKTRSHSDPTTNKVVLQIQKKREK